MSVEAIEPAQPVKGDLPPKVGLARFIGATGSFWRIVSRGAYIGSGVTVGDNVKIQNYVSIYNGVTVEDDVILGPHMTFGYIAAKHASLKTVDDLQAVLLTASARRPVQH